jgi:hypothetical protein|tara:strand:- start:2945 stop:3121 length:177 start_codon:yes stop_codon:yes gene_type:complete
MASFVAVSSPPTHNSNGIGVSFKTAMAAITVSGVTTAGGGGGGGAAPTGAEAQSWSDG